MRLAPRVVAILGVTIIMSGFLIAQGVNIKALTDFGPLELTIIGVTLCVVVSAITQAAKSILLGRQENALKREMLERGLTAAEIARVISARSEEEGKAINPSCASKVIVENEGDWCPALVLQVADGKLYVHFIGTDSDQDEWVGTDRIRFPAGSNLPSLVEQLSPERNGVHEKGPREAEV